MTFEAVEILVAVIGLLVGGGGVEAYHRKKKELKQDRKTDEMQAMANQAQANEQSMLSFYAMWNDELKRLRIEIDKLHTLVAALETEIIALGGDPVRVRLELARMHEEG